MRKLLGHIGEGEVVVGAQQMIGVCQSELLSSSSDMSTFDVVKQLHIPTMSKGETLAIWDDCQLSRDKMYLLGSYLNAYLGSWLFYPLRDCITPLKKLMVPKVFNSIEVGLEKRQKVQYWQSSTSATLCSAIQQLLDSKKKLGVDLQTKKGVFVCESGDHGNTSLRYGFTLAACEGQETQVFFHMTAVVHDKDTYNTIRDTISPGIMQETKKLKASKVLEVVVKDTIDGNILDRSMCLLIYYLWT